MAAPPLSLARRVAGASHPAAAAAHSSSRSLHLRPPPLHSKRWSGVVKMGAAVGGGQGGGEEEETRQAKEMAAARRRWETLIREQKIKTLTPREAGYTFKLTDKVLLDVRPSNERQKAWVKGSTWIPVFDVDTSSDRNGLSKKAFSFVMGGWWSGISTMSFNKNFVQQVQEKFSKDTDIILVCQKGLRSIAASEQLYNAGFENLFWVQGGLEAAEEEDFEREGSQPFKLAGIGGVSEFFGNELATKLGLQLSDYITHGYKHAGRISNVHRLQRKDGAIGPLFTGRLVGAIVLADALFVGAQSIGPLLQQLQSH